MGWLKLFCWEKVNLLCVCLCVHKQLCVCGLEHGFCTIGGGDWVFGSRVCVQVSRVCVRVSRVCVQVSHRKRDKKRLDWTRKKINSVTDVGKKTRYFLFSPHQHDWGPLLQTWVHTHKMCFSQRGGWQCFRKSYDPGIESLPGSLPMRILWCEIKNVFSCAYEFGGVLRYALMCVRKDFCMGLPRTYAFFIKQMVVHLHIKISITVDSSKSYLIFVL